MLSTTPVAAFAADDLEASTSVSVAAAPLVATPSPEVSCTLAEVASRTVSVSVDGAAGVVSVSWSRTRDDVPDPFFKATGEVCSLADVDLPGAYAYTAHVVDEWDREAYATLDVRVREGDPPPGSDYVQVSSTDTSTGVCVSGAIHRDASLMVWLTAPGDADYERLRAAAGTRTIAAAWVVSLVGAPQDTPAFQGVLSVELPAVQAISGATSPVRDTSEIPSPACLEPAVAFGYGASSLPDGAHAVASLATSGTPTLRVPSAEVLLLPEGSEEVVLLAGVPSADTVSVRTSALGAFALLEGKPPDEGEPTGPLAPSDSEGSLTPLGTARPDSSPLSRTGDVALAAAPLAALAVAVLVLVTVALRLRAPLRKDRR